LKKYLEGGISIALVSVAKTEAKETSFVPKASQKVQIVLDPEKNGRNHCWGGKRTRLPLRGKASPSELSTKASG
jgi:hypothetical protein